MQPVFYAAEINKEFAIKMTNSPTVRRRLNNTQSMPRVVIPLHLARVGIPAHRAKNSNIAKLQTGLRSPAGPRRRRKRTHAIRRASTFSGCSFGGNFADSTKPRCGRWREGPPFRPVCRCVRGWGDGWRMYPPQPLETNVAAFVGDGKPSLLGWVFPSRPSPVSEVFAPYFPVR